MLKMHFAIVAAFAFLLATELPVIVTGRPQIQLGGVWLGPAYRDESPSAAIGGDTSKPTASTGGLKVITDDKPEFNGMIQIQVFIGKENSKELVKVHESNSSFSLPPSDDSGKGDNDKSECPKDEFIYEPDKKCYQKGDFTEGVPSPCTNAFERYSERGDKPGYGECTCKRFKGSTTRPVVQWMENKKCYWLYDQGPCTEGQWLVLNNDTNLICTKRTCPENSEEDKNAFFPKFVFEHKGKCLKTETKNPEFCGNDKDMVYFAVEKPEPVCLERRPVVPTIRGLASGAGILACKAGHKQLPNGECKRTASFADFK